MKLHRVAKLFPDMPTEQFKDLVADIKENGQLEPILTCSGKIADGRHRFRACRRLKIEPRFVRWEDIRPDKDASLVTYVISRNLKRRHLDKDQRSAIATDALPLFEQEAKHKQTLAASKAGKASGEVRRKKADEEANVPADLRERSGKDDPETKEVSDPAPTKKAKTDPKKKAAQRKRESASRAAEQAGVSARDVQRAKALGKKSPALLKMVKEGTVKLVVAEKMAELDAADLKAVLAEGKKTGDYRQALKDYLANIKPAPKKKKEITQHDIVVKLKRAIKQAESLCSTLEDAEKMTRTLTIEKGEGLNTLLTLTARAVELSKQIAGE